MPLLHNLTEPQLWRLARAMLTAEFAKGDLVFKKARRRWCCVAGFKGSAGALGSAACAPRDPLNISDDTLYAWWPADVRHPAPVLTSAATGPPPQNK